MFKVLHCMQMLSMLKNYISILTGFISVKWQISQDFKALTRPYVTWPDVFIARTSATFTTSDSLPRAFTKYFCVAVYSLHLTNKTAYILVKEKHAVNANPLHDKYDFLIGCMASLFHATCRTIACDFFVDLYWDD